MALQQVTNLACRQRTELVHEADAGVELRIASQAFFKAGHTDQDHSNPTLIKDAPSLLQSRHFESVRFIDDQQRGRIGDQSFQCHRPMALREIRVFRVLRLLAAIAIGVLATITQVIEPTKEPAQFRILNLTSYRDGGAMQPITEPPDLFFYHAWRADHRGCVKNRGAPAISSTAAAPGPG